MRRAICCPATLSLRILHRWTDATPVRVFEACTMMSLRTSLRRGSVWLDHSLSFRERDQILIPPGGLGGAAGRAGRVGGMPKSAAEFLEPLQGQPDGISRRESSLAMKSHENTVRTSRPRLLRGPVSGSPWAADPKRCSASVEEIRPERIHAARRSSSSQPRSMAAVTSA